MKLLLSLTPLAALTCLSFSVPASVQAETPASASAPLPTMDKYRLPPVEVAKIALQKGDQLAICGDSITEQKMYSVLIESYLVACYPELEISCRQYGWSGEKADGFLARMDQDVLRFRPTVATTCYGMNDHQYVPFTEEIGAAYRINQTAIVERFQKAGARVVIGAPGTIGSVPHWVKSARGSWEDLNLSLNQLRNIDGEIAVATGSGFADVFAVMLHATKQGIEAHGGSFAIAGRDGVHPGWGGQALMAYAFLKAFDLDGNLGELHVDLAAQTATATGGHSVLEYKDGTVKWTHHRFPFAWEPGDEANSDTLAAGMALAPFQQELSRLTLKVSGGSAARYRVQWGAASGEYSKEELERGVDLAALARHPLIDPFLSVRDAVAKKQEFETYQIKKAFRSEEAKKDFEKVVASTESERAPLEKAIRDAMTPKETTLRIEPLP